MAGSENTSIDWWVGKVVSVKSPQEDGRVQVRIYGRHDNVATVPDSALPWALVIQPPTSAAYGRMGTTPVGLTKNSTVIGFWGDDEHQIPIVWGSIGKAGDVVPGSFTKGAPALAKNSNGGPSAGNNPTNYLNNWRARGPSISLIDAGSYDAFSIPIDRGIIITEAVKVGMKNPNNPTIASVPVDNNCPISKLLRELDPLGINSALKCLPGSLDILKTLLDVASSLSRAFVNAMAAAIRNAILKLMQSLGIAKVLQFLNNIAQTIKSIKDLMDHLLSLSCGLNPMTLAAFTVADLAFATALNGINALVGTIYNVPIALANIGSTAISAVGNSIVTYPIASVATALTAAPPSISPTAPDNYTKVYGTDDPYPGFVVWKDPTGVGNQVYTPRNGEPNFTSSNQEAQYRMESSISNSLSSAILSGGFSTEAFSGILTSLEDQGKKILIGAVLGIGFNAIGALAASATSLPKAAVGLIADNKMISEAATIIPQATDSVNRFIVKQSLALQVAIRSRIITSNLPTLSGSCLI